MGAGCSSDDGAFVSERGSSYASGPAKSRLLPLHAPNGPGGGNGTTGGGGLAPLSRAPLSAKAAVGGAGTAGQSRNRAHGAFSDDLLAGEASRPSSSSARSRPQRVNSRSRLRLDPMASRPVSTALAARDSAVSSDPTLAHVHTADSSSNSAPRRESHDDTTAAAALQPLPALASRSQALQPLHRGPSLQATPSIGSRVSGLRASEPDSASAPSSSDTEWDRTEPQARERELYRARQGQVLQARRAWEQAVRRANDTRGVLRDMGLDEDDEGLTGNGKKQKKKKKTPAAALSPREAG